MTEPPASPTASTRRCAALLALEGVLLVVVGVAYEVVTAAEGSGPAGATGLVALGAVLVGALLLLGARAVLRGRGWARSPAVVVQLLALPVGVGMLQARAWVAAAVVLLLAVVTLVHLLRVADEGARS